MHALGVVPNKVVNEFEVEADWREEFGNVIIDKLILDGAVESLEVRIHLRRLGICMVMRKMQSLQFFLKMLHKLRAVVREHK